MDMIRIKFIVVFKVRVRVIDNLRIKVIKQIK